MNEQLPADERPKTCTCLGIHIARECCRVCHEADLQDEITELRRSLRREENARKIAVSEIGRLRARIMELETPSKLPIEFRE